MKAIISWQPWASLLVSGAKRYETLRRLGRECDNCAHRMVCRYDEDHKNAYQLLYDTFYSSAGVFTQIRESKTAELIMRCVAYEPVDRDPRLEDPCEKTLGEVLNDLRAALREKNIYVHNGSNFQDIMDNLRRLFYTKGESDGQG